MEAGKQQLFLTVHGFDIEPHLYRPPVVPTFFFATHVVHTFTTTEIGTNVPYPLYTKF